MHAQNSLSACGWNERGVFPHDTASKTLVELKSCYVRLEDPYVQAGARSSDRQLIDSVAKKPLAYSLTARLRANVKIVYTASPCGIEITKATDKPQHETRRVAGNIDELSCRTIAEPLGPDGEPVSFDAAAQKFRRKNVGIRITPACSMDRGNG